MSKININITFVNNILNFLRLYSTNYDKFFNIIYLVLLFFMIIGLIIVYIFFFLYIDINHEHGFSKTLTIIVVSIIGGIFSISEYMYALGVICNSENFLDILKKLLSNILIYLPIIFSIALIFSILKIHYSTNMGYFKSFFIFGAIYLIPILLISILLNLFRLMNNRDMDNLKTILKVIFGFIFILTIALLIFMFEAIIIYTMNMYTKESCGVSTEKIFDKTSMAIYHGISIFFLLVILLLFFVLAKHNFQRMSNVVNNLSNISVNYVAGDKSPTPSTGGSKKIKSKRK